MSIDKAVDSVLKRELSQQAGRSMFSRDGRLRHELEGNVGGNIHLGEYLQLGDIPLDRKSTRLNSSHT